VSLRFHMCLSLGDSVVLALPGMGRATPPPSNISTSCEEFSVESALEGNASTLSYKP